jgi:hypothetical protein
VSIHECCYVNIGRTVCSNETIIYVSSFAGTKKEKSSFWETAQSQEWCRSWVGLILTFDWVMIAL